MKFDKKNTSSNIGYTEGRGLVYFKKKLLNKHKEFSTLVGGI
jgi:hypothetical protein